MLFLLGRWLSSQRMILYRTKDKIKSPNTSSNLINIFRAHYGEEMWNTLLRVGRQDPRVEEGLTPS